MIKPAFLYHASPHCDLTFIEPRRVTKPQDFDEGDVVFATDSFAFSTMFLVPHDDSWANGGTFNDVPYFVISDKKRFLEKDKRGCVYLIKSKYFTKLNKREWFTKDKVKVFGRVDFFSGLYAMIMLGVQVYFTDKYTYQKIKKAKDHGLSILNSLTSENERIGLNPQKFELYFGSKKAVHPVKE